MVSDASAILLPHVRRFTVGFVLTDQHAPRVLGSGVLLSVGRVSGILTCAHVAEAYRQQTEIGLLRFSRDEIVQMQKLKLGDTTTLYVEENTGEPRWSNPDAIDLAFTELPERVVATLSATCVFLNADKNWKKFCDGEPNHHRHVDAVFGLVDEFSGAPLIGGGLATTPMKGVLTPGHIVRREKGTMTLECMGYNVPDLPTSFGGTSGGGLWRMYLNDASDGSYEHVETRLCGVATFERDATHIVCQGIERIEQLLVPAIRKSRGS
jgi:hypothetical protein